MWRHDHTQGRRNLRSASGSENRATFTKDRAPELTLTTSRLRLQIRAALLQKVSDFNPTLHAPAMPKLRSDFRSACINAQPLAHHYKFVGVEITEQWFQLHRNPCVAGS